MCNCGNKRTRYLAGQSSALSYHQNTEPPKNEMWADVYFKYTGATALSVNGNITGKQYRFNVLGDVQMIDYRDVPGMATVPVLRKVKNWPVR